MKLSYVRIIIYVFVGLVSGGLVPVMSMEQDNDYYSTLQRASSSPFHKAAQDDNVDDMKKILETGGDINEEVAIFNGWTPLQSAVASHSYNAVKFLLERGALCATKGVVQHHYLLRRCREIKIWLF
jgi:Ankyrin repeats (3 copies)